MTSPPVTICVLTYGDHSDLARRTLESIREHCVRSDYRLVVGANAVGGNTRDYLSGLEDGRAIDRLILSPSNLNKSPMMRKMFQGIDSDFIWWFDDDSYITAPEALPDRLRLARESPAHHVLWGHVFYFGDEGDFSLGTDVTGFVRRATWYRGLEPPSWAPGGKGESDFQGKGTGDGRWFFVTGGCWFMRTRAIRALDWPDPRLLKRADDVFLAEAVRQQGWMFRDIGPAGVKINTEPRRGEGEDLATMEHQMARGGRRRTSASRIKASPPSPGRGR
ncbi:MAG TPA: glycosyltransferase [Planctomycetota bacterium]|nr:glycosyltransferase [Planctomycetota bacterium]